ncbi:hypothetical protein ACFOW6_09710 [Fodinicurvata halophila]|uniref:Glycosyl transferase-like sugar-binding protein n=2 Tax=Fodinicurvata halophila TaxID=1419723 RepID=A0ABV8UKJ7_9PROT
MQTWPEKHPDWAYRLYGNNDLKRMDFRTRAQIDEYLRRGQYHGVADLMRYEILYREGGYMAGADSICLHNIEELLTRPCAHTVYENELVRGELVAPVVACPPGDPFVGQLVEQLARTDPRHLHDPWHSTGNLFVSRMIWEWRPDIVIWPSYRLIPVHYTGVSYEGDGKVYANQLFGATRRSYGRYRARHLLDRWLYKRTRARQERYRRKAMRALKRSPAGPSVGWG